MRKLLADSGGHDHPPSGTAIVYQNGCQAVADDAFIGIPDAVCIIV